MKTLLAVDLGLKTGLALYNESGRLRWYRSHNFGTSTRLRRAVYALLNDITDLAWVVIEGGGNLADIWIRELNRRQIPFRQISAETWRIQFLYQREQRSGQEAKYRADDLARQVIEWSGASRPTSLRHDTAEAILIGLWGVLDIGWLECLPPALQR